MFAGSLSAASASGSVSQDAAAANEKRAWPHEKSDLSPSADLIFGTLKNGFRYVMMQNSKPEDRVSMHLVVDAGSFHETEDQRGAAHFLEHLLFSGTAHFPAGELVKYFQRIGMEFGPDVNGRTGFFETVYDLDLPSGDRGTLAEGMLVMSDYAARALLEKEQVIQERSVILAEKRTRDSPDYRTFEATLEFEFPDARISKRLPIGIEPVIKNTDRELLKSFYDTWYRPERLTLIMVGDFSPETAEKLIRKRFSGLEARAPRKPVPGFGRVGHEGFAAFYHHEAEAGNTRVTIETIDKHLLPPDSAAYQRSRLLAEMANQIVQHRLNALLNQPGTPFSDVRISSGHYLRFVRAAEISAECAPKQWEAALSAIEQNLRKALEYGFTPAEVRRVQKEYTTRLEKAVKGASTRQSSRIAGHLLSHLNRDRVFQSPRQRQELLQPAVDAATPATLHEALKAEWSADHRLLLVTGNADLTGNARPPEEQIKAAWNKSRQQAVQRPEKSKENRFPYLAPPNAAGEIQTRETLEDLGITRVVFENGVTLLLKETDFQANQVLSRVSFGHGESVEPASKPALSELSARVINASGLGRLNREQLKAALAGKSTSVSFSVAEDRFVLSADSVPDETRLMFELLYAYMRDPGLRETAYNLAVDKLKQQYQSMAHSIRGGMALEGRRFLAGGDLRFGLPPITAVEQTRLSDIRQWLMPAFEDSPIEIAVAGDIDVERVINAASLFFGSLPERTGNRLPRDVKNPDFPEGEEKKISVPTRISKGLLVAGYPTDDIWDIHRTRRLSILSKIFSDRMRIRIREEMGASYAQGAYNSPSRAYPDYGVFSGYAIIDPDNFTKVRQAVKEIAADLGTKGASPDELKRALEPTLTGIRQQLKTNEYWLNTVLQGASRHPQQLDWSRSIQSDYAGITLEEVNQMAKKYLDNQKAAFVEIRPQEDGAGAKKPATGKVQNEQDNS